MPMSSLVLYNQKDKICHISGVSVPRSNVGFFHVPLQKDNGLIYEPRTKKDKQKTVYPEVQNPFKDPRASHEWVGYSVHARCWELLTYHELGVIAERDMTALMAAVRQRCRNSMTRLNNPLPHEFREGKTYNSFVCIAHEANDWALVV